MRADTANTAAPEGPVFGNRRAKRTAGNPPGGGMSCGFIDHERSVKYGHITCKVWTIAWSLLCGLETLRGTSRRRLATAATLKFVESCYPCKISLLSQAVTKESVDAMIIKLLIESGKFDWNGQVTDEIQTSQKLHLELNYDLLTCSKAVTAKRFRTRFTHVIFKGFDMCFADMFFPIILDDQKIPSHKWRARHGRLPGEIL